MRHTIAFSGFALMLAISSGVFSAESGLFSEIRSGSVFDSDDSVGPPKTSSAPSGSILELESKVTSAAQLSRMLRDAGFKPEDEDEEKRMLTVEVKFGVWTIPVVVMVGADERQVVLILLLTTAKDEDSIPKGKLLEMMEASRKYAPTYFGYSSKHRRMELYHLIPNSRVSGRKLKEELDRLTLIAEETEEMWDLGGSEGTTAPASPSLVGKWAASRSKTEAFAIQFKADEKFVLVYINNGQQSRSKGTYSLESGKLTMVGDDGFRLAGTIDSSSGEQFRFKPEKSNSGSLLFKRAK